MAKGQVATKAQRHKGAQRNTKPYVFIRVIRDCFFICVHLCASVALIISNRPDRLIHVVQSVKQHANCLE